jgi:hypothetical protein
MRERLYRVIMGRVGEELQTRRATLLLDAGARGGGWFGCAMVGHMVAG